MSLQSQTPSSSRARTPLPKCQLAIVYAIQLSEPISGKVVYPFLPDFVRQTGITGGDESKTGYYAGIIGSVFFAAECLTVFHWGRASDVYGRRPVLLWGPLGLAVSLLGFGLSSNFWWLVVFRALQGLFNGNIGVSKTVLAELTDASNIGDAFAIMPLMWGLGNAFGPAIGGLLADPEHNWPRTFGKVPIFVDRPYLLPCAVCAMFSFLTYIGALLALKETLPSKLATINKTSPSEDSESSALLDGPSGSGDDYSSTHTASPDGRKHQARETSPPISEVLNSNLVITISNYCIQAFISMGLTTLIPLMYSTPISVGGLGLTPYKIGAILSSWGALNVLIQLAFLGKTLRRFGERTVFVYSMIGVFLGTCVFGVESAAAKSTSTGEGRLGAVVWALIGVQLVCNLCLSSGIASVQILIVHSVTSRATLGATNGLAQMAASGVRGLSPAILSALFSATLERHLVGGFLVYICMSGVTLVGVGMSFMVPKNLKALE